MVNFILADNQELTAFALKTLIREHESATVHHAADKDELVSQLQKEEGRGTVTDYHRTVSPSTMADGERRPHRSSHA